MDEDKICMLERTWEATKEKGMRARLVVIFGGGWSSIIKEAAKQTLSYGNWQSLGSYNGDSL